MNDRAVRRIPLPRAIVWEGLVDPALVEGWFDPVARLDGDAVVALEDPEWIEVSGSGVGHVRIRLHDVPGGPRDRSTEVEVELLDGAADASARRADWERRLDDLEGLLRGHPVDWSLRPARTRS